MISLRRFFQAACAISLTLPLLFGCGRGPESGGLPGHPRLILSGDFLELTRERCRTTRSELYGQLKSSVDRDLAADSITVREAGRLAEKCAFLYLVGGESEYLDHGARNLERALERLVFLEEEHGGGYWEAVEFRRYCCFAWDWLYRGLSERQRASYGEKIAEAARIAWDRKWFTPYGGGGYGTLDPVFWPAVTLAESGIDDSLAAEMFAWVDRNIHEWRKMQSQVAADDGGFYSGMAYAAYNYLRTPIYDFEIWKSVTGEDLTENNPYLRWFSLWWVYCEKPNGEWLRIDDAGSIRGRIAPWHFKYLASRYRDGVAMWRLEQMPEPRGLTVWDVLWDPSDMGIAPEGPDSTWPLARHFEGIGWVVMRSGWDSDASHSVFDCGNFYYGHQHPAENSFVLFKKGSLAINSGRYEWGSDHRPNYMGRTIAGNTMLVYDPEEVFVSGGDTLSNDGGQRWPIPQPDSFMVLEGTVHDVGDIIAFETNSRYSYVCGDATRAYSREKLKRFTRQYIHIRPDLFVIFDRVKSTEPEFSKHWLLHSVNEPAVGGRSVQLTEREGRLFLHSVYPERARIEKIGGPGSEFMVFGTNYPPRITHYRMREGEQWGSWRIEVVPARQRTEDVFLHVLLAADIYETEPPRVERLGSADADPGVRITAQGETCEITFAAEGEPGGTLRILDSRGNEVMARSLAATVQPQSGIGKD